MAERFHVNSPLDLGSFELTGPEAHHLATVCRLRHGDQVCLFNGDNREYRAEVLEVRRKLVVLNVVRIEAPARELGFRLEMAAPLPKGDRAQFLLEKLTELGVTSFTPLQTARSVVHPRDAKLEKLQRHVIEACKQCGRNVLPIIKPLTPWHEFLDGDLPDQRCLAHLGGRTVEQEVRKSADVVVAVGPEGGFTEEEVEVAVGKSWRLIDLGPRILRIETAAIYLAVLMGATANIRAVGAPQA